MNFFFADDEVSLFLKDLVDEVATCTLLEIYWRFGEACCLRYQSDYLDALENV